MARNPDGLGTKVHKWRGRWRAALTVGYHADGKPDRRWVYGKTQDECLAKLDELRQQHKAGLLATRRKRYTLAAYLDDWLEQKALEVKPRTIQIYKSELAHVTRILGKKRLESIKPADVQRMMRAINGSTVTYTYHRRPAKDGQPAKEYKRTVTLTARAANEARSVLKNALDDAMVLGLIASNPARPVRSLKHDESDLIVWTAQEVHAFTQKTLAEGSDYHALFYLALTAGLRAGELLALVWDDLEGDRLHVARTASVDGTVGPPKSKAGDRVLALASDTVETLKLHRLGLEAAEIDSPLVFPTSRGTMANHSNVRRSLHAWAAQAEVPVIRLHDLRHTYASMAIAAGVNAVDLARQLGHADASFTLRRYAHFFERATPRRAPTLAELMGSENRKVVFLGGTGPDEGPN